MNTFLFRMNSLPLCLLLCLTLSQGLWVAEGPRSEHEELGGGSRGADYSVQEHSGEPLGLAPVYHPKQKRSIGSVIIKHILIKVNEKFFLLSFFSLNKKAITFLVRPQWWPNPLQGSSTFVLLPPLFSSRASSSSRLGHFQLTNPNYMAGLSLSSSSITVLFMIKAPSASTSP